MGQRSRWPLAKIDNVSQSFSKDLTVNPETRNVKDIQHEIVAAASSSSADRASEFLKKVGASSSAKAYGSYEELVADKNVDIIYVATPHSHHYQNAMLCLEAGKNVLCEKAFTVNAAQAKKLAEKAKEKNLFLMEAVWTRYFPLSIYVRDVITSGKVCFSNTLSETRPLTFADWKSPPYLRRPLHWRSARGSLRQLTPHGQPRLGRRCPSRSRHLRLDLGLPNPLPHTTRIRTPASHCCLFPQEVPHWR